jgi:protein-arginine kinase activator protein McsA
MKKVKDDGCSKCGYSGPATLHMHHIYGRKYSDETVTLCPNCHGEVHAAESAFVREDKAKGDAQEELLEIALEEHNLEMYMYNQKWLRDNGY